MGNLRRWMWPITGIVLTLFVLPAGEVIGAEYWYFCDDSQTYYPYVTTCRTPWRPVQIDPDALRREQLEKQRKAAEEKRKAEEAARQAQQEEAKREAERAAAKRQAEQQAVQEAREAEERQRQQQAKLALEAREQADAAAGYKRVTVADILVDYKDMTPESMVIVTGIFSSFGQTASLTARQWDTHSISIDTENLSRDTRKQLLSCDSCRVTIWAHPGCVLTVLGRETEAPCLMVDRIKGGEYDGPEQILQ